MTTSETLSSSSPLSTVNGKTTNLARVVRSEWIKIRSLRSTWIFALCILLIIVGFGVLSAMVVSGDITPQGGGQRPDVATRSPLGIVLTGANLAVLIVAVMGSIVGAREFGTGMIRTTFSAVPKRLPVLWSKLAVFIAVVLPVVVVGVVAVFFLGMGILDAGGYETVAWGDENVARNILGTAYYIVGLGMMGVALGVLLRSTAAAIGIVIGAVLILPALASALLPDSWDALLKYLPSNAGNAFTSNSQLGGILLSPGFGLAMFTGWIVLAIAAAAVVLNRRDA